MKTILIAAGLLSAGLWVQPLAQAEGYASGRFVRENAAGGVSGGSGSAIRGPGGAGYRSRGYATDGQGNAAAGTGGAYRTPYGSGARAGVTTHSSDGTTSHESTGGASGTRGRFYSHGSSSYNPETGLDASRSTEATSKMTGSSYSGETSYTKSEGVTHSSTCYDAAGNPIDCR